MSSPLVQLIPGDAWWPLIAYDGRRCPVHVDVATPARWTEGGSRVEMVDLDVARWLEAVR